MKSILAFLLGGLFALGLMISGMSNPAKVLAFLDLAGDWNPSLALVMGGAIMVAFIPFQKAVKSQAPKTIFHEPIELPKSTTIDKNLIIGSLIFGTGWGIAGICPAPALTLIGLGHYQALYFIGAMFFGIWLHRQWVNLR